MEHNSHKHPLILNGIYDAKQGDVCRGCNGQIVSCKLFVYSCSHTSSSSASCTSDVDEECLKFLLHRSCAETPREIQIPEYHKGSLFFFFGTLPFQSFCDICEMRCSWFFYGDGYFRFFACIKCAMFRIQSLEDRKLDHPAHTQHPLTLVQHLASFECYACKVEDNIKDLSYICTKCPFWMHKNCADAPNPFQFQFHKHPLILSFTLPQVDQKFLQYCKLCNERIYRSYWVYYCPNCRFFAHFHCARSYPMLSDLSSSEDETYDSDVVHLPAEDESSVNLLFEQFVKALSSLNHNDNNSIYGATKGIKHWTHDEHDLQLITVNELNDGEDDHETLLVCDGCVKPIRSDGGLFYGCVTCKYFLHKVCAELPRFIKHHLWPGITLSGHKHSEPYKYNHCHGCKHLCNGICFRAVNDCYYKYDIGCVSLPKIVKHKAHRHQLQFIQNKEHYLRCKACDTDCYGCWHQCERCKFYICPRCIMKPRRLKHPWDPHPLRLIYDPGMVSDHEHDYNCEFCSRVIDTNEWFYHCSDCDLSFHLNNKCDERSCYLGHSKIKYGASNININRLHPHTLTLCLNKKAPCKKCRRNILGEPVLECAPCKAVFCSYCYE